MKNLAVVVLMTTMVALFCPSILMAAEVRVFAAASLKEALNELCDGFTKGHPGIRFARNYGASGMLAKQIENGAPADIFIPASSEWIEYLKTEKMVDHASISTLAYNTLVFVGMPGKASAMADLPRLKRIAIGSPRSVPAGEYAMEALARAGIEKRMAGKLVMGRDVRECLMYAERGEVDGALVYRTEALQATQVKVLFAVPQELYRRIAYPMALTAAGAGNRDATAFLGYLRSKEAQAVLVRYGFAVR